ncbi:MAG: cytidine deaminase [Azospira oryzae]|jgi:cytidine deaminase|nr:cytidine deaminase [Cytophaga sp.]PZR38575.1 MAG: cytidine deaminase [Azospira oryzae]
MKQQNELFQFYTDIEQLDDESKYLVHRAKEATAHAYAPYSRFQVGAAALLEDGTIVSGANQENAAYPMCLCAERVALAAVSSLHPGKPILKIAVVAHKKNHKELVAAAPCGACRQVLTEYENRQSQPLEIVMLGPEQQWVKCASSASLLPFGFGKESLE